MFDPRRYQRKVNGSDYLEVKWRVAWLRSEHPDASIETSVHELTDQRAVFRASITLPSGASSTGYGSESPGDFRDYIEKAETKAIGRACSALGFDLEHVPGAPADPPATTNDRRQATTQRPADRPHTRPAAGSSPALSQKYQTPRTNAN